MNCQSLDDQSKPIAIQIDIDGRPIPGKFVYTITVTSDTQTSRIAFALTINDSAALADNTYTLIKDPNLPPVHIIEKKKAKKARKKTKA
jgi:hypothetical protein